MKPSASLSFSSRERCHTLLMKVLREVVVHVVDGSLQFGITGVWSVVKCEDSLGNLPSP